MAKEFKYGAVLKDKEYRKLCILEYKIQECINQANMNRLRR